MNPGLTGEKEKTSESGTIVFRGKGISSKKEIEMRLSLKERGHGIVFSIPARNEAEKRISIPANARYVVNTLRNVTLGIGSDRLCLVEHILCAAALWGLEDLFIEVDGPEIPLEDGSAMFFIDLFEKNWNRCSITADLELKETLIVKKQDRLLLAIPDERFSVNYMMDWNHPQIGKIWQAWDISQDPRAIADARTFGSEKEHAMLGLGDDVVSLGPDGFNKELRFADEPVRHKLLDLIGDLSLSGVNPLRWKARFISIKGGHEMDVELAGKLQAALERHAAGTPAGQT